MEETDLVQVYCKAQHETSSWAIEYQNICTFLILREREEREMVDTRYQREKCRERRCEKNLVYPSGARYCQDTIL